MGLHNLAAGCATRYVDSLKILVALVLHQTQVRILVAARPLLKIVLHPGVARTLEGRVSKKTTIGLDAWRVVRQASTPMTRLSTRLLGLAGSLVARRLRGLRRTTL